MWLATYEISIPLQVFYAHFPPVIESKICKSKDIDDCKNEILEYLYEHYTDYMEAMRTILKICGFDEFQINSAINEWIEKILTSTEFEGISLKK